MKIGNDVELCHNPAQNMKIYKAYVEKSTMQGAAQTSMYDDVELFRRIFRHVHNDCKLADTDVST